MRLSLFYLSLSLWMFKELFDDNIYYRIYLLFELPNDDANGQEQKEAREEHRKEDEQINVGLILKA